MIHHSPEDKIIYEDVHDEFLTSDPWGDCKDGKFIGRIVIPCELSTGLNVPVYEFNVEALIDDFCDSYGANDGSRDGIFRDEILIDDGFEYKDESLTMAKGIVSDLKAMTARLEAVIAKSEEVARKGGDE